jgi:hypothetical protein
MFEHKIWIVTLNGERPLTEVERGLVKAGFVIGDVLDAIRI